MTSTVILASSLAFASPAAAPAPAPQPGDAPTRHVRVAPAPPLALTPSPTKLRADRSDGRVTLRLA